MDFTFTEAQHDIAALAADLLAKECTPERLKAVEATRAGRFDADLWRTLAAAGLVGAVVPEEHGGAGLGVLEMCSILIEAGRRLAPVPLDTHLATSITLRTAAPAVREAWLARAAAGEAILTSAIAEEHEPAPVVPTVRVEPSDDGWTLTGTKVTVPAGTVADLVVVTANGPDGPALALVEPDAGGVSIATQTISDGSEVARMEFAGVQLDADRVITDDGAAANHVARHTVAVAARQFGVVAEALRITAEYATTREQFGRAIGSFQAVAQRLADGYIDVLGAELTLWQAAWRLDEGLPAEVEVATAKLWAADAGHRVAHTTVHVHGGVGIDLDGEAHRYFTGAKMGEFHLGGATHQERIIGALLATEPA